MQVEGNHKTKMPPEFLRFIKDIHTMCKQNRNAIVGWGFSRGGRWLEELVRENSLYVDVAFVIAGYPPSKGEREQTNAAKELMAVKSTIVVMLHFAADFWCNASVYPHWFLQFELAMAKTDADRPSGFFSYILPGAHDAGHRVWSTWSCDVPRQMLDWKTLFEQIWFRAENKHKLSQ